MILIIIIVTARWIVCVIVFYKQQQQLLLLQLQTTTELVSRQDIMLRQHDMYKYRKRTEKEEKLNDNLGGRDLNMGKPLQKNIS